MKRLNRFFSLFILLVSLNALAAGVNCYDTDKGISPKTKGQVSFDITSKICTGDSCSKSSASDIDYCKNSETLVEFYCDPKGVPSSTEIKCKCLKGICQ